MMFRRRLTKGMNRPAQRVPGHRAPSAHRGQPYTKALPNAHICTKHRRCKVPVLVLSYEVEEGQEGQWRDCQLERGV